jgi:O-antigen ligase
MVVVAELVLAAGLVVPRLSILAKLAFVAALVGGVLRWPMVAAGAVLVGVASVVSPTIFILSLGPLDLRGYELALGALLLAAVLVPRRRSWGGVPGGLLAAFLVSLTLASGLAILDGRTDLTTAYGWARNFGPLLLFYPIVRLFPGEAEVRRLLTVGAVLGGLTGLVALLIVGGVRLDWLFAGASERFIDTDPGSSFPRVRLPGGPLAYGLLWFAVSRILATVGWSRVGWTLAAAGIVTSIGLSLNRNMWIGVAFGLVLLLVLGRGQLRRGAVVAVVAGASVAAVVLLIGLERQRDTPLTPLVARGETLLDPRAVARSDSLQSRFSENERAWEAFAQRPLTGIGAGTSFGVFYNRQENGIYRRTEQLFLHNQYLYLLVIAGVPGLAAFVGFLIGVLARARLVVTEHAVPCALGLAMIVLSAVVMISFANSNNAAVLALLAGALMALPREQAT